MADGEEDLPVGTLLVLPRAVWEKTLHGHWVVTGVKTRRRIPAWRVAEAISAGAGRLIPPGAG